MLMMSFLLNESSVVDERKERMEEYSGLFYVQHFEPLVDRPLYMDTG